jgi:hypothetical protein
MTNKGKTNSLIALVASIFALGVASGVSAQTASPLGAWHGEIKCDQTFADHELRLTFPDITINIYIYPSEGPELLYIYADGGAIPPLVRNYGYYAQWFSDPAHPSRGILAFSEMIGATTGLSTGYTEVGQADIRLRPDGSRSLTGDSTVLYYQQFDSGSWPPEKYTATCTWKFVSDPS